MYCCPNCFADQFIGDHIKALSTKVNSCSFCGAKDVSVLDPALLADIFQPVISLYKTCTEADGIPFLTQLENDWEIFRIEEEGDRKELLCRILRDDTLVNSRCKPVVVQGQEKIEQWNEFREELKHRNRYFPKKVPESEEFKNILSQALPSDSSPEALYRARINIGKALLTCNDMGKPDKLQASNGRANPIGIPYLYTASDERTAIAEVRPHKGDVISVSKQILIKPLKFADLRQPQKTISPFKLDEDILRGLYKVMPLLVHLGEELAKPVLPREAELEYLPSQYLCEMIKDIGFHGVIYKSSLEDGDNYAIFNDELVECLQVAHYIITDIRLTFESYVA